MLHFASGADCTARLVLLCEMQRHQKKNGSRLGRVVTHCFPVGCWSPMDCAWGGIGSLIVTNLCSRFWITTNFQRVGYTVKFHRCNKGKMATFLDESPLWTKPGLIHSNQTWNATSNEWKHPGSPRRKKVRPTQCAVKVMFIVACEIDGILLHHGRW